MPKIKQSLETLAGRIPKLLAKTEKCWQHQGDDAYGRLLAYKGDKFTDEFIEEVYQLLCLWDMNSRGAKLQGLKTFKKTLLKHQDAVRSLNRFRIETLPKGSIEDVLYKVFSGLKLTKTNTRLLTVSKTLHFFLPDLLMPVDRKYTLSFLYKREPSALIGILGEPKTEVNTYLDVFEEFRSFAQNHASALQAQPDSRWLKNIPKNIDNLLIGSKLSKKNQGKN